MKFYTYRPKHLGKGKIVKSDILKSKSPTLFCHHSNKLSNPKQKQTNKKSPNPQEKLKKYSKSQW